MQSSRETAILIAYNKASREMYDYEPTYDASYDYNLDEDYLDQDEEYHRDTQDLVELAYVHYA